MLSIQNSAVICFYQGKIDVFQQDIVFRKKNRWLQNLSKILPVELPVRKTVDFAEWVLSARNRAFFPLVLNKMDITSYLISIDVNSTLYDEVNAPIQNSLECQHKNSLFLNVLSWTKTKSYTDRLILSTQLKSCCSKVVFNVTFFLYTCTFCKAIILSQNLLNSKHCSCLS